MDKQQQIAQGMIVRFTGIAQRPEEQGPLIVWAISNGMASVIRYDRFVSMRTLFPHIRITVDSLEPLPGDHLGKREQAQLAAVANREFPHVQGRLTAGGRRGADTFQPAQSADAWANRAVSAAPPLTTSEALLAQQLEVLQQLRSDLRHPLRVEEPRVRSAWWRNLERFSLVRWRRPWPLPVREW